MEKLKEHFNFQIVEVLSAHDARSITEEKADFIISTVPLRGCRLDVHCSDWKDAIPHEGLEQGSIKVGMSLIRLNPPVEFGADDFDLVEFVCCLSAVDHKMHLKAFFNLVNMLGNPQFKEALKKAATPEEAAMLIEKYEYTLGM